MNATFIYALCDPRTYEVRYIGKADNPHKRFHEHLIRTIGHTKKICWIRYLLRVGLRPIIQILEQCDLSVWQQRERFWISFYKDIIGCELTNGATGGFGGGGMKGHHHSDSAKEKMRESKKTTCWIRGKHLPEHVRNLLSESKKGTNNPNYGKKGPWHEKKMPQSARDKMRLAKLGNKASETTKEKMRAAQKRRFANVK